MDREMMKTFAIIAIAALAGCASTGTTHAKVGAVAPSWSEATVAGPALASASLSGKPIWMNFFATWCPPCNDEAPVVQSVASQFAPQGLQVVGIDEMESPAKAKQFVDSHGLKYQAVVDTGVLQSAYNINGMPVNVFIDKNGVVRAIEVGELDRAQMVADVKKIL